MKGPFFQDGEVLVHTPCSSPIYHIGDGISYCEACEQIAEGETEYITEAEWEKANE